MSRPSSAGSGRPSSAGSAGFSGGRTSSFGARGRASTITLPSATNDADDELPHCSCHAAAVKRTVKKEGLNKGKEFFVCAKAPGLQCRYFEWAEKVDTPVQKKRPAENFAREPVSSVPKRPRHAVGSEISLELHEIDKVSFSLGMSSTQDLKTAVKSFDGLTVTKTSFLGVEKVLVPIDKAFAFAQYVKANAATSVNFSVPRVLLDRITQYRANEKQRERQGDVVTTALDEVLPPLLCEKLMDFQWHGIHFALKRGGRCLIGDDMGLGKTLQAIAVARVYMADWPLLIICPSSLRLNWKEELLRWLEDDLVEDEIRVLMTGKDIDMPLLRVNIVSYDLMRKVPPNFVRRCQFIIADESHYLKSTTAQRSKAITPLLKSAKRALLLSGTPALSRPVELFPQINAISPILFPQYQEYVERYCAAHVGRFGYDVSGASNLDELHTLLRGSLLIRRKKEEVLTQLPEKQRQVLWVQTKPKIMKDVAKATAKLERAKANVRNASDDRRAAILQNEVKAAQNELYTLSGMAKLDSVKEFCKDTAETGCKFIVFVHHNEVMEALDDYVSKKLKLGLIRIDGGTSQGSRQMLCRKFQEEEKCRVALLSITAAGVGLTLTRASVVLFAELYWNPGSLLQAEDRAHRIGQRDCVLVKYLLARRTIDESMWSTVRRKLTVVGQSLTGSAARMDVTEGQQNEESAPGSIASFFKRKQTSSRTVNGTIDNHDDVIEIEDEDITQSLRPSHHVTDPPPDGLRPEDASCSPDIQFPTTLRDIGPSLKVSEVSDKDPQISSTVIDAEVLVLDEADIDLGMARQMQEQIDADSALARKLQAQFDAEDAH